MVNAHSTSRFNVFLADDSAVKNSSSLGLLFASLGSLGHVAGSTKQSFSVTVGDSIVLRFDNGWSSINLLGKQCLTVAVTGMSPFLMPKQQRGYAQYDAIKVHVLKCEKYTFAHYV